MDMRPIKTRMEELGLDLAGLNRRYCELRQRKGDAAATPNKRRGMLSRILKEESEPTLQTLQDLLEVLGGELVIRWVKVEEVSLSPQGDTPTRNLEESA
jgi:transcriptional regulator with XRE-family HTH domain